MGPGRKSKGPAFMRSKRQALSLTLNRSHMSIYYRRPSSRALCVRNLPNPHTGLPVHLQVRGLKSGDQLNGRQGLDFNPLLHILNLFLSHYPTL